MSRYNQPRGRGTDETPFFPRARIKSEGRKGGELISANSENTVSSVPRPLACCDERAGLAAYLAANPGMTMRDYKGKGFTAYNPFDKDYVAPGEPRWDELDPREVREAATTIPARFLSKAQRQAAARDTELIWDEGSRSYCRRADGLPSASRMIAGDDGEGARKVPISPYSRPAAATEKIAITSPRASARAPTKESRDDWA